MKLPKIFITTYHEAFLHRGGGEFEMAMIANDLKKTWHYCRYLWSINAINEL